MAESNQRTQLVAGIFVLCGLVLLGGLIMEFGPLKHRMRKPYTIHAVFADAQNLIVGSPVRRAGAIIGKLSTPAELVEGLKGVKVSLEIYPEYQIPENSHFKITTIGLMGDCAVDVVPPRPDKLTGKYVPEGATVDGEGGTDLTTAAAKITDEATEVMKDIRNGIAELNKTISRINSGVLSETNLNHVSESLAKVNTTLEKIETKVLSEENSAAIRDSLALLKLTMQNASSASIKADRAMTKIDTAMDLLGPGMKGFAGATDALRDASDALEALLREARSGKGVLYALLNNSELRDNVVRFVANIRRHGLLFYKDKAPAAAPPAPPAKPPGRSSQATGRKR